MRHSDVAVTLLPVLKAVGLWLWPCLSGTCVCHARTPVLSGAVSGGQWEPQGIGHSGRQESQNTLNANPVSNFTRPPKRAAKTVPSLPSPLVPELTPFVVEFTE